MYYNIIISERKLYLNITHDVAVRVGTGMYDINCITSRAAVA